MISSKLKFSEYMLNISRSNVFGRIFLIVITNNFQINVSLLISEQSLVLSCVDVLHIAITCLHCKYVGTLHTAKLAA